MINKNKILSNILPILIYIFPFVFILGNLSINIFVFLISLIGIIQFREKLFFWRDKSPIILIVLFFIILFVSTLLQINSYENDKDWIKSVLFFRYLLLLVVVKTLIYKNILNLNYFLCSCFFASILISFDIIVQYFLGQNFIGNKPVTFPGMTYYTGFFNKELIAGGFIQMFSLLGVFALPFLLKSHSKAILLIFFTIILILFLFSLFLAGNRIPIAMFLLFIVMFGLIINKKIYKIHFIITSIIILSISALIIINSKTNYKRYTKFLVGTPNPVTILKEIKKKYPELEKYKGTGQLFSNLEEFKTTKNFTEYGFFTGHLQIYITSVDLIIDNPIIGSGIKSFRNKCSQKTHLPNRVCESHPHNFILDILNDTGLVGLLLIISPILIMLYHIYREYLKGENRNNIISNWIYLAIILSISIQFFPIKSSGSFFSTFNSAYTFLILGILVGLNELRFKKNG